MHEAARPQDTVVALAGARGLAAVWVVLYHAGAHAGALGLSPFFVHGWRAVDFFFILSGFLLMRAHGAGFAALGVRPLAQFTLRRVLRVYPLATVVLLLIGGLALLDPDFVAARRQLGDPADFTPGPFLRTLFLATRWLPPEPGTWNEPTWSLSAEIAGYAAFPLLAVVLMRVEAAWRARLGGAALIVALVVIEALNGALDTNLYGTVTAMVRMSYGLLSGMAFARAQQLDSTGGARWGGPVAAAGGLALALACVDAHAAALALPGLAALVAGLAAGPGLIGRALSSRPALVLGAISFPLYLVHLVPLLWLEHHLRGAGPGPARLALAGYGLACLAAAYALHRAVERPMNRLAVRMTSRVSLA